MYYENIGGEWVSVTPVYSYSNEQDILSYVRKSGMSWEEAVSALRSVANCIEANNGFPKGTVFYW